MRPRWTASLEPRELCTLLLQFEEETEKLTQDMAGAHHLPRGCVPEMPRNIQQERILTTEQAQTLLLGSKIGEVAA